MHVYGAGWRLPGVAYLAATAFPSVWARVRKPAHSHGGKSGHTIHPIACKPRNPLKMGAPTIRVPQSAWQSARQQQRRQRPGRRRRRSHNQQAHATMEKCNYKSETSHARVENTHARFASKRADRASDYVCVCVFVFHSTSTATATESVCMRKYALSYVFTCQSILRLRFAGAPDVHARMHAWCPFNLLLPVVSAPT